MAEYDGSIRIGTKIDTKGFKDGEKEIESESRRMAESVSKTSDQIEKELENLKNAQKSFLEAGGKKTSPVYQQYEKEISELQNALQSLKNTQDDTEIADEHWNLLRIDVEEYAKALKELHDQGKFFGDEDYDKIYLAWKNATDAVKAYQSELNKQTEAGQAKIAEQAAKAAAKQAAEQAKIAEQEAKAAAKKEAAQRRAEEQAEKARQKENARIQKELENQAKLEAREAERKAKEEARIAAIQAKEEAKRAKEVAAIQEQEAEEQRLAQIRESAVVGNQRIVETVERIKQLEQEIADLKAAERTTGYKDYDDRIAELSRLKQEVKDYNSNIGQVKENYKKLGNTAKKSFDKINKSAKKSNGFLSTMASRFKGLALSLLLFNQISKAFNALARSIKEGFENLYNEVESFKNAVDGLKASSMTLKNSFAAAFRPLVEMAIPYIQKVVEWLTILMDKLGQFIALAMGQKTYTKAIKQTTAALKDQNKAQNRQLSSLDKLNNLTSDKDGGAGAGVGDMFEEVPLDNKLPSIFEKITEYAQKIKDIFAQGFWDGLGDWEYRWESIKSSIASIKDSLVDIWTDSGVLSAADRWTRSVTYMLGSLVGSTASIGLTVADNILGGIANYLEQNKDRIKEYLISIFDIWEEVNYMFSDLFQSIAYVFEAFASEQGQQLTANIIGIFADAFMGITELASKVFRNIAQIIIKPFTDNKEAFRTALEGFLRVLSEVTGTIKQGIDDTFAKLNEVYDEHFKPFFDSIANGLSDTVGKFMEFWNGSVQPILDEWAESFDILWKEHIQPAIDKFIELLGKAADFLKAVWENVLKPFIDWIIENVLPVVLPIIDGIVKALGIAFGAIADVVGGIIDIIGGILDFLTGVFTGDWEKAWDGIVSIFDGVWEAIKGIVNGILGVVEALANGVINGINFVIGALNGLSFDLPDWLPGDLGGKTLGFNIPELSNISIPRLATGTVVPPNREFMAILGDNKREPEVVSPISTMKQAVLEAIAEAGGIGENATKEISITIPVVINGREIARAVQKIDLEQFMRTGKGLFAY